MFKKKTTGKLQSVKDSLFTFIKGNRKKTIATVLLFMLGGVIGSTSPITQEEYDNNEYKILSITQEITKYESQYENIEEQINELSTYKEEISATNSVLTSEITSLSAQVKTEEIRIASEEKAKAEAEKLAAEQAAKAEAERIAAEQAEAERLAASSQSYGYSSSENYSTASVNEDNIGNMVWITRTGSKYHSHGNCGNSQYVSQVTREQAEARGLGPCSKCY